MKVQLEDIAPGKKRLSIEVPSEEVNDMLKQGYMAVARDAEIEGFRKGKVPQSILRQKFGKQVIEDAGAKLIEKTYPHAVKEKGLKPLAMPTVAVEKLEENSPFLYSAIVDVRPEIEVRGYKETKIEKRPAKVTEDEVNEHLEALRQRNREFRETINPAREGDRVTVDVECMVDGVVLMGGGVKDYTFIIGEGARFPEFQESVKGASAGGKAEFKKSFPPGYHDKRLAGKEALFLVSVKTVKEKLLPPLDDEFAKDLSCENLEELKGKLKEELEMVKEKAEFDRVRREVMEKLLSENPFTVPDGLVDRYYTQIMSNIIDGVRKGVVNPLDRNVVSVEAKARYREMAAKQAKGDIILDIIADKEGITVSGEDLNKAVSDIARGRNESPEAIMAKLTRDGALEMFREGIRREKVMEMMTVGAGQGR